MVSTNTLWEKNKYYTKRRCQRMEDRNKFVFNEQRDRILEQNQVHFSGLHFTAFQTNKTFGYLPSHGALS